MSESEQHWIEIDGLRFAVRVAGKGRPIMLLHGFPDSGAVWRHQTEALASSGRMVIVPDLRGCGDTDAPKDVRRYRLDRLVEDVIAIADAVVPDARPFELVGHDWGAALGWRVCASYPERVHRYAALSVGHPEAYRHAGAEQKRKGWYLFLFVTPRIAEAVLSAGHFRALARNAPTREDAARWRRDLSRPGRLTAGLNWYRANLTREGMRYHLPAITVPTLGLYSDKDIALAEDQMKDSKAYVSAEWRYAKLEGIGHWLQIEAPEETNRLLLEWFGESDPDG